MTKTVVMAAIIGALVFTAAAQAKVTDPRKCSTVTPDGPTKHSYWCAHNAAVETVRTVMARKQSVTRWFSPTFCSQNGTLLRWVCTTLNGGTSWRVLVVWRGTATGWHRYATVAKAP